MTPRLPERRVLLIELVIRDPWIYYGRFFPFYQALARKTGAATRWLCYGGAYGLQHDQDAVFRQYLELDEPSLAHLRAVMAEFRPSHLILSDALSDRQLTLLLEGAPDLKVVITSDRPAVLPQVLTTKQLVDRLPPTDVASLDPDERRWYGHISWQAGRTDWYLEWLGESATTSEDFGRYLVDAVPPDFRGEMANAAAREYAPPVMLMGGIACDHRLDLRDNACFAELAPESSGYAFGCSFCSYYRGPTCASRRPSLQVAEEQLAAALEHAAGAGRVTGAYVVHDARLFLRLDEFARMVLRLGLPPSKFTFSPRVDRFLRSDLEGALKLFAEGRHVLSVYRMGGENLLDSVNERFNKGVSTDELDRARELWTRLQREYPDTFAYDGTLGYITFTPWTTLEELREGYVAGLARGFREDDVWIYTPLELQPAARITALARHEGLTCEHFEDPAFLYKVSLNNISPDALAPWRFRDPRASTAFRLILRYVAAFRRADFPDGVFDGDDLYAWLVDTLATEAGRLPTPAAYALAVIQVVEAAPDGKDLRAFARQALDLAERPREPAGEPGALSDADRAADRAWRAAAAVVTRWLATALPDVSFELVAARADAVRLRACVAGTDYDLAVRPITGDPGPCVFRTKRLAVTHGAATPIRKPEHLRRLRVLTEAFERVAFRKAAPAGSTPP